MSPVCHRCATPVPDASRFCSTCGADVSGEHHGHSGTLAAEQDCELFNKLQAELGTEYVLERELGRGGMAVVYLGHDPHLLRKVAVKVLPPELTFGGGSMIERFKREAQTAAKLDHPNIIPVHRVASSGKLFWYVMKYLDGEALDDILDRESQLAVERTVDIVAQVAAALDYAHQNHVVHRDVKPANILIDKKGWCTVTDFGIAKALDANTLTASGSIIGTPYYMSPEQCKGKKVGPAADQYSLAVMTYQMLGGHVPFSGDSAVEIVHKHVADPVPPLDLLRPNLPESVVRVVERGLAKTAEERFATVAEFAKALKAASLGVDFAAAPPVKSGRGRVSKTALVSPVPGAMRTARGAWRGRIGWIISGVAAIIVAVAVLAVLRPDWRVALLPSTAPARQPELQQPTVPPAAPAAALPDSVAAAAGAEVVVAAETAAAAPRRQARVVLSGVPTGAVVQRDGRPVSGTSLSVEPGRRHTVAVLAPGFEPWSRVVAPREGELLRIAVVLRPGAAVVTAQPGAPAATPSIVTQAPAQLPRAQPQPGAPEAQQPTQRPPAAEARPGVGHLSLGTLPRSTIYVNGAPAPRNPLVNLEVPAGTVRLRFQVADTSGLWWAQDREVTVRAGDTLRLGFIRLARP